MKYVAPEFEIVRFDEEDVITASWEDFCSVVEETTFTDGENAGETVSICHEFDNEGFKEAWDNGEITG